MDYQLQRFPEYMDYGNGGVLKREDVERGERVILNLERMLDAGDKEQVVYWMTEMIPERYPVYLNKDINELRDDLIEVIMLADPKEVKRVFVSLMKKAG